MLILFWIALVLGIFLNKFIFDFLESLRIIDSTPLSLYDVIQITAIISLIYIVFRQDFKIEDLKNKITKLNREIAIKDSYRNK